MPGPLAPLRLVRPVSRILLVAFGRDRRVLTTLDALSLSGREDFSRDRLRAFRQAVELARAPSGLSLALLGFAQVVDLSEQCPRSRVELIVSRCHVGRTSPVNCSA